MANLRSDIASLKGTLRRFHAPMVLIVDQPCKHHLAKPDEDTTFGMLSPSRLLTANGRIVPQSALASIEDTRASFHLMRVVERICFESH